MAFTTDQTSVIRFAAGLYGVQLGKTTFDAVDQQLERAALRDSNYLNTFLNSNYTSTFGGQTSAAVAATVATNLGIVAGTNGLTAANVTSAVQVITATLNAAAPSGTQGAALNNLLNNFATNFTTNAVFGPTVVAFNAKVAAAQTFASTGTTDVAFGTATPVVVDFNLGVGVDNLTGNAAANTFTANVVQNSLGQQVNTLGSGDKISGGAGVDTLAAKVSAGVFAGNSVSMPIQPETTGVENIKLQAVNATIGGPGTTTEVFINAKDMLGVTKIASNYSDANLVIQNLTTKNDAGVARAVSDLTVGMEYTGNADSRWEESDMAVYFDQDYLKAGVSTTSSIEIRIVNNLELRVNNKGLLNFEAVSFNVGTQTVVVDITPAIYNLTGKAAYDALVVAIQARLVELNITNVTVSTLPERTAVFTDDLFGFAQGTISGSYSPIQIVSTSAALGLGRAQVENTTLNFNGLNTQLFSSASTNQLVTINVDLEKAGLAGDGGQLVIGSMNKTAANAWNAVNTTTNTKSGVEQFNITAKGTEDQSSSLSALLSTNNNLRVVTVKTDAAVTGTSFGDLTIGNSQTAVLGARVINQMPQDVLPSAANANALKDVQTFDASAFKGDLKVYAGLTSEVTAKYMTLVDQAPAAAGADNVSFTYTGGTGNDVFNIAIDSANLASAGTTTREDLLFSLLGGAGNDNLTLGVVDAAGIASGTAANWYANSKLNANLRIDAGDGDDTVWTPGSGDVVILGGAGNDTVYSDNTGTKAAWAFNGTGALNNLLSDANNSYNLFKSTVLVNFKGLEARAVIPSTNGVSNDLAINQAIKAAINGDAVLNKLLLATDGPANTLVVTSKIDGSMLAPDLVISLAAPAAGAITAAEYLTLQTAYSTTAVPVTTPAQVDALLAAGLAAATARGDYIRANPTVDGTIGTGISDHNITGGAGSDVLVLSTDVNSNEVLVYAAGFGNDTIVNFVSGTGSDFDRLDFTGMGGRISTQADLALSAANGLINNSIIVVPVAPDAGIIGTAQVGETFNAAAVKLTFDASALEDLVATSHVFIAFNTANVGSVYTIVDGVGVDDSVVTLQGTIDLADTLWATLTTANFAGSTVLPGGVVVPPPVVPGAGLNIAVNAATVPNPQAATPLADTFTFASGTYGYSIGGFAPGDKLVTFAGAALAVTPDANDTDGIQLFTATNPVTAAVVTITLTGLTAAQDAGVFNVPSFNTVFGAGTFA